MEKSIEPLSLDQIHFAIVCMRKWICIREENGLGLPNVPDVDHSSLLHRLLSGKEPLDKPPPKSYSYPNYELAEGQAVRISDEIREGWLDDEEYNLVIDQSREWKWASEYRGILEHKTWGLFNTWTESKKVKNANGTEEHIMVRMLQKCTGV